MTREDAIEIIRKNMPSDKSLPVYEAIQTLVPELAENDDERIREEMIRYFTEMKKGGSAALPYDDCIAYLEKQKDLDKMIVVSPEVWDNAISDAYENGKEDSEKQKEQKPNVLQNAFDKSKKDYTLEEKSKASDYAESILPTSIMYGESEEEYKLHTVIEAAFIAGQKEQKPVEKQDYSGLNDLEKAIHRGFLAAGVDNVPVEIIKETAKECLTQMKPAEWSEEDRRAIDRACVALRAYANGDLPEFLPSELLDYADRLQSLRPRPHWKPSEEQMKALHTAAYIDGMDYYGGLKSKLLSLYEDLKKLM